MKHHFIVNKNAGNGQSLGYIEPIEKQCKELGIDFSIIKTDSAQECINMVSNLTSTGEKTRIYAVGGDGTLNNVINGVVDFNNTEVGVIPCGTGNDFVKTLSNNLDGLLSVRSQLLAHSKPIDYITVNGVRCINICNIGLDSDTAYYMQKFKPFLGKASYYLALAFCIFRRLGKRMRVVLDGGETYEGFFALAVFGNGKFYGGAFKAAPDAKLDDSLLDVCLVNEINHFTFLKLVKKYKNGEHVSAPEFKKIVRYRNAKTASLSSPIPIRVCNDGEILIANTVQIGIVHNSLQFIVP